MFSRKGIEREHFKANYKHGVHSSRAWYSLVCPALVPTLNNVISMDDRITRNQPNKAGVRDRRYAIRFPFAADVELIDMESGTRVEGVTSDISLGGCFICTSKPLPIRSRIRVKLSRKGQSVEALAAVRILKPRIGMG